MTDKALISSLTWRSLEMQKQVLAGMPIFVAPDDLDALLRPSTRRGEVSIHVVSLGVIAANEKDLRDFARRCRERRASVYAQDGRVWLWNQSPLILVESWRSCRRNGAAKIGARISADKKKAVTKEAVAKIQARWPSSSDEWPTSALLEEACISLNAAKRHLGNRPIAQANYRAAQKRKTKREESVS